MSNITSIPTLKSIQEYITKLQVENFPSRAELLNFLDAFLLKKDVKNEYTSEHKDNMIIINFNNPVNFIRH